MRKKKPNKLISILDQMQPCKFCGCFAGCLCAQMNDGWQHEGLDRAHTIIVMLQELLGYWDSE